ncbi:MAG: hypothetical protein EP338_01890 [Bacteroidetes bacterium]|nr:MAG: hypothetical protein EP338_01890 [Bacteroidota bacterium]
MKKVLLSCLATGLFAFMGNSQIYQSCQNDAFVEANISAVEAQGWVEVDRAFAVVDYLVEPETPYLIGFLSVSFAPDCDPGEPCPKILRIEQYEAYKQNDQICLWRKN